MAGFIVSTAPTAEPVSLQEVKEYMRVENSTDERVLRPFIETARRFAEEYLCRALMQQTFTLTVDAYDDVNDSLWEGTRTGPYLNYYKNHITLPRPPVQSVTSVSTFDDADTQTTMAASKYYVDTSREPGRVVLRQGENFPTALRVANAIQVVYVAGYTSAYAIPEPIRMGIMQHIAFLYEHRGDMYEAAASSPPALRGLYSPYVVYQGAGSNALLAIG